MESSSFLFRFRGRFAGQAPQAACPPRTVRPRAERKRLQATELAVADDPFARLSDVDRAVDDAFLAAVRDGAGDEEGSGRGARGGKSAPGKGSRTRMKRAGRPGVPKAFGSRSR